MALLIVLSLAIVELALGLYARNVVASAAHEAARAAVELDSTPMRAVAIGERSLMRAAGGLVSDVDVAIERPDGDGMVRVLFEASVRMPGPLPFNMPMRIVTRAYREGLPE
jgi:hypothetical protein